MSALTLKSVSGLALAALGISTAVVGCGTANFNATSSKNETSQIQQPGSEVHFATDAEAEVSLGLTIGGAHCRIDLPVCQNGSVSAKQIIENEATHYNGWRPLLQFGSPYQAESCRLRAVQYARWCGNLPGQTVKSSYVAPNGTIAKTKTADNGKIALVTVQGLCLPSGVLNLVDSEDSYGEAFRDADLLVADADQRFKEYVAYCGVSADRVLIRYKLIRNGQVIFTRSNR